MGNQSQICHNCNCTITEDENYCAVCGQKKITGPLSIWELSKEFISSSLSFDSKITRTLLPLFFQPGKLTKEFLDGKRAKYFSPVKLFIFFLTTNLLILALISDYEPNNNLKQKVTHQLLLDTVQAQLQNNPLDSTALEMIDSIFAKNQLMDLEKGSFNMQLGPNSSIFSVKTADAFRYDLDSLMSIYEVNRGNIFERIAFAQYVKTLKNPDSLVQYLFTHVSWGIFFIIPLVTLFLKLLYWRKKNYTEHLIFILHFHAFLFAILTILMGWVYLQENTTTNNWLWLISIYILVYHFLTLRTVYQSSIIGTLWRMILFLLGYFFACSLAFLFLGLLSFALF